jgi:hypothetical protein
MRHFFTQTTGLTKIIRGPALLLGAVSFYFTNVKFKAERMFEEPKLYCPSIKNTCS